MSWIVESLLRNKVSIKTKQDIEADDYNNLLIIEKKIDDLHNEGFLSDMDMYILELASDGRSLADLEEQLGKGRAAISRTFVQICDRVAYFLGGYFTDDGFLHYMKDNYRLSDEEVNKVKEHIESKYKHKLIRSQK